MGVLRYGTAAVLAGVVVVAHLALQKQFENNGLWSLDTILVHKNKTLPNTKIPLKLPSTGLAGLDSYFNFMLSFFWVSFDPRNVRAHLQGNHLLGTLSSIWIIQLLEAHGTTKAASAGIIFSTYFLEIMGELLGIGLFTPIWCIVHLLITSAPSTKSDARATKLSAPKSSLRALGYALLVGHVVPTVLMLQLEADGEGVASKQIWTIARLFHPVYLFVCLQVFKTLFGGGSSAPATDAPQRLLATRRKLYQFSILASGFFHVTSLAMLFAEKLFAGWLRDDVLPGLHVGTMFIPAPFWTRTNMSFETAVAVFLQWDYTCSAGAIVIWAASQWLETVSVSKTDGTRVVETLGQSVLVALLAGPAAAAAFLLQERDTALAAGLLEGKGPKQQ
ncbi:hypothetical protein CB0940_06045 [Cercospora beticola]|uniref:Uncharacterized protein n=1 Tax=Cercospora beticola TaxID=122368 RepID=A0A2G5HY56_CERBT|nr:hypothetical protein CB0940_06045 [Cercospora beticola]PIA97213.1 hypothetical protein CB0940_06045 [Cercospora beticola]WPA98657.1 hypothetical protein RHO25_003270 [Cercospora beticola]CAK1359922.1 unnamed protein product [Cercospora beticola]